MEFQEVFAQLRQRTGLSQSEVAERLFVTRQAVSRWERGETIPEVETLQALSRLFGVSINTLLGSPRTLVCQSCGMPLNDDILAKNTDGSFNEQYCMWCWDGEGFAQDAPWRRWWSTACPTCPWAGRIRRRAAPICGAFCPHWGDGKRTDTSAGLRKPAVRRLDFFRTAAQDSFRTHRSHGGAA